MTKTKVQCNFRFFGVDAIEKMASDAAVDKVCARAYKWLRTTAQDTLLTMCTPHAYISSLFSLPIFLLPLLFPSKMIYGGRVPIQFELASRDMTGDDEGAELEPFYVRLVVA